MLILVKPRDGHSTYGYRHTLPLAKVDNCYGDLGAFALTILR